METKLTLSFLLKHPHTMEIVPTHPEFVHFRFDEPFEGGILGGTKHMIVSASDGTVRIIGPTSSKVLSALDEFTKG